MLLGEGLSKRRGRQVPLSFRDGLLGNEDLDKTQMNRLIWGDNLLAMQALLAQGYEGKINLICIDPPFDSKADYSYRLGLKGTQVTKEPSFIERLAYKDTWAGGLDSYLDFLFPRLHLMKRLLAEDGVLYLHIQHHVGHYVKVLLDEVFGREKFKTEIIWYFTNKYGAGSDAFDVFHHTIFHYAKTESFTFNPIMVPIKEARQQPLRRWNKELGKNEWLKDEQGNYLYRKNASSFRQW